MFLSTKNIYADKLNKIFIQESVALLPLDNRLEYLFAFELFKAFVSLA